MNISLKYKLIKQIILLTILVAVPAISLFGNHQKAYAASAPNGCYQYDSSQVPPQPQYFLDNILCTNPSGSSPAITDPGAACYIQKLGAKGDETGPFVKGACPDTTQVGSLSLNSGTTAPKYGCGSNGIDQQGNEITGFTATSIDFGCNGDPCRPNGPGGTYCNKYHNGITDLIFAIIRFLSAGVGIIVVASIVVGGIQYTTSRDDPSATNAAITRIRSSLIALLIFIFAYAILNYLIPIGFFGQ